MLFYCLDGALRTICKRVAAAGAEYVEDLKAADESAEAEAAQAQQEQEPVSVRDCVLMLYWWLWWRGEWHRVRAGKRLSANMGVCLNAACTTCGSWAPALKPRPA